METKWAERLDYEHAKHPAVFPTVTFRVFLHHFPNWLQKVLQSKTHNSVSISLLLTKKKLSKENELNLDALMILRSLEVTKPKLQHESKIQTSPNSSESSPRPDKAGSTSVRGFTHSFGIF